jgi:hypothetical protein
VINAHFDPAHAMDAVAFVDRYFRVRGNEGYEATLSYVVDALHEGGFADENVRSLALGPNRPTWTPRSASLTLLGEPSRALHVFETEADRDRGTLFVGSDAVALSEFDVVDATQGPPSVAVAGRIVLGSGYPGQLFRQYVMGAGAAGILTTVLDTYNDPEVYPDAAGFGYLPDHPGVTGFGFSLSTRSLGLLLAALAEGPTRVEVGIDVVVGTGQATTVEATIPGSDPALGPVVLFAHTDEPGAVDNATGVATLLELAIAVRTAVTAGELPQPQRPIVFLWGQEYESSAEWLGTASPTPFAGLALDMVGSDYDVVGAPFLVERMPDPGAVWVLPPDQHTAWGSGAVDLNNMPGHFLNDYVLAAVGTWARHDGHWAVSMNPYEGGSDHDNFLALGIPSLLGWHFTDSAYHTNLDRLDRVSGLEMSRVAASFGAVTIGLSTGSPEDAAEMFDSVMAGAAFWSEVVFQAAAESGSKQSELDALQNIADHWQVWYGEALESVPDSAHITGAQPIIRELFQLSF